MTLPVALLGLATAVPPHWIAQDQASQRAHRIFAPTFQRYPQLSDIFTNAGIKSRYSIVPIDWFDREVGLRERTLLYLDGATSLYADAAKGALEAAGIQPEQVDIVVTISSTGIATPSLEARAAGTLGLRADAARIPVFGLGCAGGVTGLSIGSRFARSQPGAIVLVVAVELCTLAFRGARGSKADVVATALFGDGAAAAVLQATPESTSLPTLGIAHEHTWPNTLDIMGWTIDPIGLGVVLSRALPRFVETRLAAPARRFVASLKAQSQPAYVCHPGGTKVLVAMETALGLESGTLATERAILRDYGNMSSPTALFVLQRSLAAGLSGPAVMSALGPGFTASFLAIEAGNA